MKESDDKPDEDKTVEEFYRILDEVFGAFDREGNDENWVERANKWFINEFQRFSQDVDEIMAQMPELVGDDPDVVFGPGADCVMDAWIDGRHYEIVISRIDDSEVPPPLALPEPTVRMPIDSDEPTFTDDFVDEWI